MTQATTKTDDVSAEDQAQTLKTVLQAQADDYGEVPDDARVTITVTYESKRSREGNIRVKHGDVWRATDNRINFSEGIGTEDEDAYFLKFTAWGIKVVSVSERGNKTELGEFSNLVIED